VPKYILSVVLNSVFVSDEGRCYNECCLKAAACKCGRPKCSCCERTALNKKIYILNTSW